MRRVLQFLALGAVLSFTAAADTVVIDVEGLPNADPVLQYFNGGQDGAGSTGPNDGVVFDPLYGPLNPSYIPLATSYISDDDGGGGAFAGNPNGDTALTFLSEPGETGPGTATMDVAGGFNTSLSFWYSANFVEPETIYIWSGLDETGTILAAVALPATIYDPTNPACSNSSDIFCPFYQFTIDFSGTAQSVDFEYTEAHAAFDGITFDAGPAAPEVSEPDALRLFGLGLVSLLVATRRQRRVRP